MPKLTYYGHSAFLLEDGDIRVMIDPFLTGNPHATVKPEDAKASYVLLSHGHADHLGDAIQIAKANDATIVANYELATHCGEQGANAHPMHIGGGFNFPFGRVKLTIAHHGSGVPGDKGIQYTGPACGLLVTMKGKTIYHTGDTGLFYDMKLIGEMNRVDVALVPIGDNFTMGLDDAVKAVELINPALAIPMHYDTFPIIPADPNEFVKRVEAMGKKALALKPGQSHDL